MVMIIWPTSPQPHFLPELTFTCTQSQSGITGGGNFYSKELSDQERVSLRKSGLGWPESIWTKRHSQDKHLHIEDIMSTKVAWYDHIHFLNFRFHCPPLSQLDLVHLLFVLHGCTQHHQIVASTHIFVFELNKSINDTHPHIEIFHTKQMCHEFDLLWQLKNVWEPAECSWHLSTSRNPFWPSHLLVLTLNLLSLLLPQFNCCCSFSTSTIWPQVTRIHTPSH